MKTVLMAVLIVLTLSNIVTAGFSFFREQWLPGILCLLSAMFCAFVVLVQLGMPL